MQDPYWVPCSLHILTLPLLLLLLPLLLRLLLWSSFPLILHSPKP